MRGISQIAIAYSGPTMGRKGIAEQQVNHQARMVRRKWGNMGVVV
jgi:hypothetical protein